MLSKSKEGKKGLKVVNKRMEADRKVTEVTLHSSRERSLSWWLIVEFITTPIANSKFACWIRAIVLYFKDKLLRET